MVMTSDLPNTTDVNALVTRAVQQAAYYCGAACCVMVLAKYNAVISQDKAYKNIRADDLEPDAYYSDPAGISILLNSPGVTDTLESNMQAFSTNLSEAAGSRLINNIQKLGLPTPILVNGGAHWVVIDGVRIVSTADNITLLGAYIVDPFPTEVARKYVTSDSLFQAPYITESQYGTKWKGLLVLIAGPALTSLKVILAPRSTSTLDLSTRGLFFSDEVKSPLDIALRGLATQGFSGLKPPIGGGGPNNLINVTDINGTQNFSLILVDATENATFSNMIYAAVDDEGVLLEVASDASQVVFLDDSAVNTIVQAKSPSANVHIFAGYFWMSKSILRSRFSLARKVMVDGTLMYAIPSGELVSDLGRSAMGGGLAGCPPSALMRQNGYFE